MGVDNRLLDALVKKASKSHVYMSKHSCVVIPKGEKKFTEDMIRSNAHIKMLGNARGETYHAETMAMNHHPRHKLKGATLIVIRFRNGELSNSKPCEDCQKAIQKAGIRKVIYST